MSISYEREGRTAQKARTREALIDAARELLAEGIDPTVEQAAARANVSRPTAYRYFSNRRSLVIATNPEIAMSSLLGADPPQDPVERLKQVAKILCRLVLERESALRAMLGLSLEDQRKRGVTSLRTGRRIVWIEDALAPLRFAMSARSFRRLVLGVGSVLGVEALVWLTDVVGLSRADASRQMQWCALELVRSAQRELQQP